MSICIVLFFGVFIKILSIDKSGADIHLKDSDGDTAFHCAMRIKPAGGDGLVGMESWDCEIRSKCHFHYIKNIAYCIHVRILFCTDSLLKLEEKRQTLDRCKWRDFKQR